jgi:hypothetical protein
MIHTVHENDSSMAGQSSGRPGASKLATPPQCVARIIELSEQYKVCTPTARG